MDQDFYVSVAEIAAAAGLTERTVRRAAHGCLNGGKWRGSTLDVVIERGVGGAAGRNYLISVGSLPWDLREAISDEVRHEDPRAGSFDPATSPEITDPQKTMAGFRRHVVREAKRLGVKAILDRIWQGPRGPVKVGRSTIYDWLKAERDEGMLALTAAARADRGTRRHCISRLWEAGCCLHERKMARIEAQIEAYAKSCFRSGASYGKAQRLVSAKLADLTRSAGFSGDDEELREVSQVSRHWLARFRKYRRVYIRETDAKRHFDKHKPRIARTIDGMRPMQWVYGDVHPADIMFARPDGAPIRVRLIAWQDHATHRFYVWPVLLTRGRGVRQGDVVEAFAALTQDERWGLPAGLYLDNGGEYNILDEFVDAMSLSAWAGRERPIIKAIPYNAQAKVIESTFAKLEQLFQHIEGYIGGDRMRAKTHNVGKAPRAFSGTPMELQRKILEAVAIYNSLPQKGLLRGRSPNDVFEEAVAAGWQRTGVSVTTLDAVFSKKIMRHVDRGAIKIGGVRYYCDAIATLGHGDVVAVRVPVRNGVDDILVYSDDDTFVGVASPDRTYLPYDRDGARESARRSKIQNQALADLRRDAKRIDLHEEELNLAKREGRLIAPALGGVIALDEKMTQSAEAVIDSPSERQLTEKEEEEKWLAKRDRLRRLMVDGR